MWKLLQKKIQAPTSYDHYREFTYENNNRNITFSHTIYKSIYIADNTKTPNRKRLGLSKKLIRIYRGPKI